MSHWLLAGLPALCLLVWIPGHLEQFEAPKAHLLRAVGLATLLGVALRPNILRARWRDEGRLPRALDLTVLALLLLDILSSLTAVDPLLAVLGEMRHKEGLLTTAGACGLYFGLRLGGEALQRRTLLFALLASVPMCIYALVQAAGWDPLVWAGGSPVGSMGALRPFSTQGHANHLGVVACGLLGAALVLWLRRPQQRWWLTPVTLLLVTTSFLAFSRAGWLGALVAVFVACVLALRTRPRAVGLALLAPLCIVVSLAAAVDEDAPAPSSSTGRYTWLNVLVDRSVESARPSEGSARSRWEIWRSAIFMARAHPWTGVGPDHFGLHFPIHQTPEYWQYEWGFLPVHAHSLPLHVLATRGVFGALGLIVLVGLAFMLAVLSAVDRWLPDRWLPDRRRELTAAAAALASGVFTASLFGSPTIAGMALLAWALSALASNAPRPHIVMEAPQSLEREGERAGPSPLARYAVPILQSFVFLFLLAFAVQETRSGREAARALAWAHADPARALDLADRAVARMPIEEHLHQVRVYVALLAAAASENGQFLPRAQQASKDWLRRNHQRSQAHQRAGAIASIAFSSGNESAGTDALKSFERAIELAPLNGFAMAEYARALVAAGRTSDARAALDRALALYPDSKILWQESARFRLHIGDVEGAAIDLHRAEHAR